MIHRYRTSKFQWTSVSIGAFVIGLGGLTGGALGCGSPTDTTGSGGSGTTGEAGQAGSTGGSETGGTGGTGGSTGGGGTGGSTGGSETGGGGTGGTGGGTATLDVLVGDPTLSLVSVPSVANVRVLFDPPGGGAQQEAISDAKGHVHFDGIDWSKGSGALTAIGPDTKAMYSFVDVNPDNLAKYPKIQPLSYADGPADVYLPMFDKNRGKKLVSLSGALLNAMPGGVVTVAPSVIGTRAFQVQGTYDVKVLADTPLSLFVNDRVYNQMGQGWEATSTWMKFDVPALTDTTVLDLDLAAGMPLTPLVTSGKLVYPGGANGPFATVIDASMNVFSQTTALVVGLPIKLQPDPGGGWSYDSQCVTVANQEVIHQGQLVFPDFGLSVTGRYGLPVADEVFSEFLLPPKVTQHGLDVTAPVVIDPLSGPAAIARVVALDASNGDQIANIDSMDPGVTQITRPKLPDDVIAKLPGKLVIQVAALGVDGYDSSHNIFMEVGIAPSFLVSK